jgi:D-beta-D-heptose 7-phosphate kinase/D-beta-D-heptose 1-phosphate adenosyltransferase
MADSQMLVRFDQGDIHPIEKSVEDELIERLRQVFPECDALIISDYGYGVLTPRIIGALAELQAADPRVLVADAKEVLHYRDVGVTAVKPNYNEAVKILGRPHLNGTFARSDQIAYYGEAILAATGARIAAVTLDTEGALILERGRPPYRTYAEPHPHSRATGAGDTFVSGLTLALAAGAHTTAAAELASAASAIVVEKDGTAACFADELRSYLTAEEKLMTDWDRLASRASLMARQGKRVVFTNGVFDILHAGHITYLNQAKELGDVLVVGVNSDESVRRLKGAARPINALADRVQVLAGLSSVDIIVPFDEDTPATLIEVVRPAIFVKGGDYTRESLPEAPLVEHLGGLVQILPLVEERSTTGIIERICRAQACRLARD